MVKTFNDFFEGRFLHLEVPKTSIKISEEPKENTFTIVIIEHTDDHNYANEPESTKTEDIFFELARLYYDFSGPIVKYSKNLQDLVDNSHVVLTHENGNSWRLEKIQLHSVNFGFLGGPVKVELKFSYESNSGGGT